MSPVESASLQRVVVVGAAGAVGSLFAGRLRESGSDVYLVDRSVPPPGSEVTRFVHADAVRPNQALIDVVGVADAVLLAVPEPVVLMAIAKLGPALRPDALVVDTASVKSRVAAALAAPGLGGEAVSLNPLFAPSLGFSGNAVASVVVRPGDRGGALLDRLRAWGARVVTVDADRHDRVAAATQALTHAAVLAFGAALIELDVDFVDLHRLGPPPHAALLSLMARIASGAPEVYWDVQEANPHAHAARHALSLGLSQLGLTVDGHDRAAFYDLLDHLRDVPGPLLELYATRGERGLRTLTADLTEERIG
jgi:4-amino-4-deoxyprephenate dehydrogenase